jgi:hypothetical protein
MADFEGGHRDKLLGAAKPIDATTARLDASQKAASEAEHIGIQIYDNLRQQRDQLQRAAQNLSETDANMNQSNRLLRDMIRRFQFSSYNIVYRLLGHKLIGLSPPEL